MVIWIIGLSGSGKTTLGRAVVRQWREWAPNTVLVDGDEVRRVFAHDQGDAPYTPAGRRLNAQRITELCAWLDDQGMNVVCCILSLFPELRAANRQRFSRYFEIYLAAPVDVLAARDTRNLYAPALRGETRNVAGVDIRFPEPETADMVIDTSGALRDGDAVARDVLLRAGQTPP
ncbi:MAG: adenylyl-sulfate kinase [Betaproteobacteria bacterium]